VWAKPSTRPTVPTGCRRICWSPATATRSSLRPMVGSRVRRPSIRGSVPDRRRPEAAEIPTERWILVRSAVSCGRRDACKATGQYLSIDLASYTATTGSCGREAAENVRPRIARMLGHDKFDFEWGYRSTNSSAPHGRFIHGASFSGDARIRSRRSATARAPIRVWRTPENL